MNTESPGPVGAAVTTVFVYEHLSGGVGVAGSPDGAVTASSGCADLVAAGAAMRDAVVADLLSGGGSSTVRVTAADGDRECAPVTAGGPPAQVRHTAPRSGESAVDFVARESACHDLTWVIAPETGGWLGRLCAACAPPRWLGCRADAIALTSSKRATVQRLAEHGLCTPLAFASEASSARRWVVKPDDGAGALSTRQHRSHDAAAADAAARPGRTAAAVVEPWVDGHPISLSLLCSALGSELLSVNRQLISVDAAGMVHFERVDANVLAAADRRAAPLHALARQISEAIDGLRGFVGVDLVWHAKRGPVVIEVNPRVTTAYVGLPDRLKRRLAAGIIEAHLEEQHGNRVPGVR